MNSKILMKRASMMLFMFMLCAIAFAQRSVKGSVKDATGEPIIGANVLEKGSTNGTITDVEGNFTLSGVSANSTLVISYIGYISQEVKADKKEIKVVLQEDSKNLDEVVVVGYGVQKKSDVTGSVSSVSTEQLNAKGAPSVMENLQGSTPGVNITQSSGRANGGFNIEIRGKSSINSSTTPLYVVDGVMCDDIDWLNPQDIERVDVLKDASSTAIYGSRATAGVVMVTTKGSANVKKDTKTSISYDGYYGVTKTARMPEFMNGEQFYKYRFLKFLTNVPASTMSAIQADPSRPAYGFSDATTVEQCLLAYEKGTNNYALKQMLANNQTTDWADLVTRTGVQQNHYIAVSGSGDKFNYHMGVGYNQDKGIYDKDDQNKINFKGSLDGRINKVLSAGFTMNLARQKNSYADDTAVQYAYRMNPFMVPYDENGNVNVKSGNYEALGTDPSYQFSDQVSPLKYMDNSKKERETWKLLGNAYLKFDIIKGLDFKTTFSPSYTYYREGYVSGIKDPSNPHHTYANEEYETLNSETGLYETKAGWNSVYQATSRSFSWTWDNVINWNHTFNTVHNVSLMGLYSMQSSNSEKITWKGTDQTIDGSDWWSMGSTTYDASSSSPYSEFSMTSYALRGNYSFAGKYMVTGTVRWDGSSKFADGYRWGCFPSAAVAWRLSEEKFLKKVEFINNLKLRLSYGVTGNCAGIGNYATQSTASTTSMYYPLGGSYSTGYDISGIVDKSLQWETSDEYNVGLDFGFLDNRISGTIDWYNKTSHDLLYSINLPLVAGGASVTTNVGKVRNTGIEISLKTINVKNKDWEWSTTFNFSKNNNEVKAIDGIQTAVIKGVTGNIVVGESYNTIWGYATDGIVSDKMITVPNTQIAKDKGFTPGDKVKSCDYYYATYGWVEGTPIIRDVNGDGSFDTTNDRVYRNADPKWTGSFSTSLSYKNLDFSMNIYAKIGQYAYSNFMSEYLNWGDRGRQKLYVNYYIPAGTLIDCDGMDSDGNYINPVYQEETHYGDYPFPNNGNTVNGFSKSDQKSCWDEAKCITKTSFVKVKNITVGYTFPKKWLKPFGCSHFRLYGTITNPFVFSGYKGFDPEWADAALKNDGPSTITYQIGASIKF